MNLRRKSVFAESYEPGEEGMTVEKVFVLSSYGLKAVDPSRASHFVLNEQLCRKGLIVQTLNDSTIN